MNKLVFPNGGMPLHLDDLDFMQEATREGIKGLLHRFASEKAGNLILSGCIADPNGSNYDITEGFIMIDYEVLYFAGVTNISTNEPYFELDVSYDPNGNDAFFDNVSRDTYEIRRAVINTTVPSGSHTKLLDENRLEFIMSAVLAQLPKDWGQAYVDAANKKIDLTKDVFGNPLTATQIDENLSKKYIYSFSSGTTEINQIEPIGAEFEAREYTFYIYGGRLKLNGITNSGYFIYGTSASELTIEAGRAFTAFTGNRIFYGLGNAWWYIKSGNEALVNASNRFVYMQKWNKTNGGLTGLSLNLELYSGNTVDVSLTPSSRTLAYIKGVGTGTHLTLAFSGARAILQHAAANPPATYKPIILPLAKNLELSSEDATIQLVEFDTHWRMVGSDFGLPPVNLLFSSLTGTYVNLTSGRLIYRYESNKLVTVTFDLEGTALSGVGSFIGINLPFSFGHTTYSSCVLSVNGTNVSARLVASAPLNSISIFNGYNQNFAAGDTVKMAGQINIYL